MSELKTRPNDASVAAFLSAVENTRRRQDSQVLLAMFSRVTPFKPVMWGDSIVGFGSYAYTNTSGTYDWLMTGFSPRKRNLVLYIMQGFASFEDDVAALGKATHSSSCLYINKLADIDLQRLERFLETVVTDMHARYEIQEPALVKYR